MEQSKRYAKIISKKNDILKELRNKRAKTRASGWLEECQQEMNDYFDNL